MLHTQKRLATIKKYLTTINQDTEVHGGEKKEEQRLNGTQINADLHDLLVRAEPAVA